MTAEYRNALPPGTQIAEYRLEKVLSLGGVDITYLARDENLGMPVVIKEYLPNCAMRGSDLSVQPKSVEDTVVYERGLSRFREAAQILARFDDRVLRYFHTKN